MIKDVEDAITQYREALSLLSSEDIDPANYLLYLNNLARALGTRFKLSGRIEDLNDGIAHSREALSLYHPESAERTRPLVTLANAYHVRFKHLARIEDLDQAILLDREIISVFAHNERPRLPLYLSNLANALHDRFEQLGGEEDLAEAFEIFERAATDPYALALARFEAANQWTKAAHRRQHYSAMRAYSEALILLSRSLIMTPTAELQQGFLALHTGSLASDAASCAIAAGQVETAVELLDQGRAILWSKMQGYRHPLEKLRMTDPTLAEQFELLATRLEQLATSSDAKFMASPMVLDSGKPQLADVFDAKFQQHHTLTQEFDEILNKIRRKPGFDDFLQAIPFSTLRAAAAEGPVIIVNISEYGSHAIILLLSSPPILVSLPKAIPVALGNLASELSQTLGDRIIDPSKIVLILRDIWQIVVHPVRAKLADLDVAEKTRIWWCPTSMLCALPLHAACPYSRGEKNLPDIYISSHIPTLSALIRARSGMTSGPGMPRLLAISQSYKDQPQKSLLSMQEEITRIQQLGMSVRVLADEEVTPGTVLSELQQHSWAHLACHGRPDNQLFHSSFELYDNQRLTLLEFLQARLPNAEFAFLSACHSAAGNARTPDESIHLAAAMQFCGFQSTVGTLWEMVDDDGPNVVEDFYTYMFRKGDTADFRDSAMALNEATKAMRKRKVPIDRWICFVHIGA